LPTFFIVCFTRYLFNGEGELAMSNYEGRGKRGRSHKEHGGREEHKGRRKRGEEGLSVISFA
jgi:hypothetical protein